MKSKWIHVITWLLCLALMAGLVYIVREDKKSREDLYARLEEQAAALEKEDSEYNYTIAARTGQFLEMDFDIDK